MPFSYSLLSETATLQFHFACGHLSIPPPLQPCVKSLLGFNLSLLICLLFSQAYIISSFPFTPSSPRQSIFSSQEFLVPPPVVSFVFKASSPPLISFIHQNDLLHHFLDCPHILLRSLSSSWLPFFPFHFHPVLGITLLPRHLSLVIYSLPFSHPYFQLSIIYSSLLSFGTCQLISVSINSGCDPQRKFQSCCNPGHFLLLGNQPWFVSAAQTM